MDGRGSKAAGSWNSTEISPAYVGFSFSFYALCQEAKSSEVQPGADRKSPRQGLQEHAAASPLKLK